ncbi:MAG TPA: flavoprotein [Candidatus Eisenbacteria bacterium]|jgi:phosphopantothenoylcysteine decarboxylase/phosphopantothenate--cysteine ligase|nr:flavoprotein [Candidatus Eisenbacteria bacterium]
MSDAKKKTVLLGVSASISAYRALDLITDLREAGYAVRVAMTRDAHHFVTPLSLQSMAASEVVSDFFSVPGHAKPVHIELAQSADVILVAPASADILARLAHGFADDVVSCAVLASDAPLVVVPAMNEKMYNHPATRENLATLKKRGVSIVEPIHGHMVCSGVGMGHIAENKTILKAVAKALA